MWNHTSRLTLVLGVIAAGAIHGERLHAQTFTHVVQGLAVDPTNSQVVFAGTFLGLFKTVDGGTSWARVTHPDTRADFKAVAFHPTEPCTLYTGNDSHVSNQTIPGVPPGVIVYNSGDLIWRSIDCGLSWTNVTSFGGRAAGSFAFTSATPPVMYVYINRNGGNLGFTNTLEYVLRGTPQQFTFPAQVGYLPIDGRFVVADPSDPCGVYIVRASATVLKSISCTDWTLATVGTPLSAAGQPTVVRSLAVHPTNQSVLAGTASGLLFRKAVTPATGPRLRSSPVRSMPSSSCPGMTTWRTPQAAGASSTRASTADSRGRRPPTSERRSPG